MKERPLGGPDRAPIEERFDDAVQVLARIEEEPDLGGGALGEDLAELAERATRRASWCAR